MVRNQRVVIQLRFSSEQGLLAKLGVVIKSERVVYTSKYTLEGNSQKNMNSNFDGLECRSVLKDAKYRYKETAEQVGASSKPRKLT